jgi:hypothetical protein
MQEALKALARWGKVRFSFSMSKESLKYEVAPGSQSSSKVRFFVASIVSLVLVAVISWAITREVNKYAMPPALLFYPLFFHSPKHTITF